MHTRNITPDSPAIPHSQHAPHRVRTLPPFNRPTHNTRDAHSVNESLSTLATVEGSILKMANGYNYLTAEQKRLKRQLLIWKTVGMLAILILTAIVISSCSTPVPPTEPAVAGIAPSPNDGLGVGSYGDGMYEVGAEIQPGTYKTDGPPADSLTGACYWAKHKNADGDFNDLSSNKIVQGRGTVTIKSGGYVEFSGGCIWTKK